MHTTSLDALNTKEALTETIEDALCTPLYCIAPSKMTLYKAKKPLTCPPGWETSFLSTTGEIIHLKKRTNRNKRDTSEDIEKITYLEEETARLTHRTDMLYHIIQQLRTLFWMASGVEPAVLGRRALNRQNIVAESRDSALLVWGCITVKGTSHGAHQDLL